MTTGKIKWWNEQKGFGFIVPDDGSPDLFLHISGWNAQGTTPIENQRVTFRAEVDKKRGKVKAVDVEAA